MRGLWRGMVCAGVLAAIPPTGVLAAPLLAAPDPTAQPAPARPSAAAEAEAHARARAREAARVAIRQKRVSERDAQEAARTAWVDVEGGPIVKMFRGGEGITLDLTNMHGDIVVVGGKGREGKVSIRKRVAGNGPEVEELLRDLQVDFSEHANRVSVRSLFVPRTRQHPRRSRVRTDYEIALPAGTALELKNMQGNVRLRNVAGDVRVEAVAGDVVAEALSRVRLLRSMSGDVTLTRSTLEGDVNLQTVSGDVLAQAVKARTLTLGSVSGRVQVRESTSDRALVRTVSGNIEFAAAPRKAGRYELRTHAGDIFVHPSGGPGFEFEASTFRGDVQADVPTRQTEGAHQVRGSVGDGSAYFDLSTFTGTIKVAKAP